MSTWGVCPTIGVNTMLTGEAVMIEDQEGRVAPVGDGWGSAVLTGDGGDGVASETDLRRWCWSDWRWCWSDWRW
jgi:hypothetical protein